MEACKRIGPNFVYIIGLCGLLAGAVSAFLLQSPSYIHTADSSQEWSEWTVVRTDPICVLLRQGNCSDGHCNSSEFRFCKEIVQWGEWAPSKCTLKNNACFISRVRSCSILSLKTCDSNETNADIRYWGNMSTCPCRIESTESTPDPLQGITDESIWLEWNAWECHDNLGCLMVRRRRCPKTNGCAGDNYELGTCKVDKCDQLVTWNSWGEWSCYTQTPPCVRYKHRNCSSGRDSDCQAIGGTTYELKPCDPTCNSSTTPNPHLMTNFTTTPVTTIQTTSAMTSSSSLSTTPTTVSTTLKTSVLTTLRTSIDGGNVTTALPTTTGLPTTTEYVPIYWLEWSGWKCSNQSQVGCLMTRSRNCSRPDANDCKRRLGEDNVEVVQCKHSVCPATWSEWGNWTCRMGDHGTCNMIRTRICSTGVAEDCGIDSKMIKPCDQNLCPDKIHLHTTGQCKDYVSVGSSCSDTHACDIITDIFHPICKVTDMATKNCPKACGCCDKEPKWTDWSAWECKVDTSSGECKMIRKRNCSGEDQCEGISNIVTECDDKICSDLSPHWLGWSDWECSLAPNHTCKMTRTRLCSNSSIDDCAGRSVMTKNCLDTVCPDIIQLSRRVDCSAFDTQNTKCKDYSGCGETYVISNLVCLETFGISECPVLCGCCDPTSSTNNTAAINGTLTNNTTTNNSASVFTSAATSTRWTSVYNNTYTTSSSTLDNSNSVDVNLSSVTVPTTHNDRASVTTGTSIIDYSTSSSNVTANGNGTDSNNTVTSNSSDLSSTENPTSKDISTYPTNASSSYGEENTSAKPPATSSGGNVSAIITTESTLSSESTTSVNFTSNSTNDNNITSTNNATSGTVNNTNNTNGNTTNGTINSSTNTTSLTVTTDSVLTTESTTKPTTTTTTVSSNNQPVTCKVCAGPEFLCEKLTMDKQCDYPNNYCINKLSNHKDGTRTVIKSCGNYDTCYRDWFLGSSDSDKCRKFDDNNMITLNFACTYCCTKDLCNDHIRPPASTLFKAV